MFGLGQAGATAPYREGTLKKPRRAVDPRVVRIHGFWDDRTWLRARDAGLSLYRATGAGVREPECSAP